MSLKNKQTNSHLSFHFLNSPHNPLPPLPFVSTLKHLCLHKIQPFFLMWLFHLVCSGLQSLWVVFSQLRIVGHWIWQLFQALPTRTARGSRVSARGACSCKVCCSAGAWLDVCLPLKRQQWLLMTWKVLCKPSACSVFRNGTVCCAQKVRPALGFRELCGTVSEALPRPTTED